MSKNLLKNLKFSDLYLRVISALVMIIVAVMCIYLGTFSYALLLIFLSAVIFYEANGLLGSKQKLLSEIILVLLTIVCFSIFSFSNVIWGYFLLVIPAIFLSFNATNNRIMSFFTGILIILALMTYFELKLYFGNLVIFWLVSCVAASDIAGYFIGRLIGGPKIWVVISPNKTWSGTIAGWIAASLVGFIFMIGYDLDLQIVLLSFIVVIFAQAGDFYESWLKRRIGKKDSSKLIPGHGGFLDRFDGLIGGAISVKLYLIFTGSLILVF